MKILDALLGKDIAIYVRAYKGLITLSIVLTALSAIFVVIPAYLLQPFIDEGMIRDILAAARETGAAGPVIDTEDTIVIEKDRFIEDIPERKSLKRIQTPQGFRYEVICTAHERALEAGVTDSTDDCGMVLGMGGRVSIVRGSVHNIKLTMPADMALAGYFITSGLFV